MNRRNPKRKILPPLPRNHKPRLLNHIPKLFLPWKPLDTLHQILITGPIPRHQLPNQRYGPETPPFIDSIQQRVRHAAKFQTREDTAGFEDAVGFAERGVFVGEVADAEGDGVEVDAIRGDGGEVFGVGDEPGEAGGMGVGGCEGAFAALGEHGGVYV